MIPVRAVGRRAAQVDAGTAALSGELPDGVIVLTLDDAAREHSELVQRRLGTVVSDENVFVARSDAGFSGGAFVYAPCRIALAHPILRGLSL